MPFDSKQPTIDATAGQAHADEPRMRRRSPDAPSIRPLARHDIPQLCALFASTFRSGRKVRVADLGDSFEQLYLSSPLDRERPASLVDVGPDGRVAGFIGTIALRATLEGKPLRAGVLGNFMAVDTDRARVAIRLMRATLAQDLDFIFSDTANHTSLALSRAQKFEFLPTHSLEWVKVLRPAGTARAMLERRLPTIGSLLAPLASLTDIAAGRLPLTALPPLEHDGTTDSDIDADRFVERAPGLLHRFRLRLGSEDGGDLAWLLDQARRKTRNGTLRMREVLDRNGRTEGLYLVYARPGGVAHALQVLARRGRDHLVLAALIRHVAALGAVAVRGSASPSIIEGLTRMNGIFYHQVASAVIHARDPAVRDAVHRGDAMIGGLMGETWTRLVADEFVRPAQPESQPEGTSVAGVVLSSRAGTIA